MQKLPQTAFAADGYAAVPAVDGLTTLWKIIDTNCTNLGELHEWVGGQNIWLVIIDIIIIPVIRVN